MHTSQATLINKRLEAYSTVTLSLEKTNKPKEQKNKKGRSKPDFCDQVAKKLAMGDIRGAVNLVTSRELILPPSEDSKQKLQSKHPK